LEPTGAGKGGGQFVDWEHDPGVENLAVKVEQRTDERKNARLNRRSVMNFFAA
jgi:hypothetical protein